MSKVDVVLEGDVADAERLGPTGLLLLLLLLLPFAITRSFAAAAALGSAKVTLLLGDDVPVKCESTEPSVSERDFLTGEGPGSGLPPLDFVERCWDEDGRPDDDSTGAERSDRWPATSREDEDERTAEGLEAEDPDGRPASFEEDEREVSFGAETSAAVAAAAWAGSRSSTPPIRTLLIRRPGPAG